MGETTKTLPEQFHKAGYDREEEYFFQMNRELIERNRRELDEQRRELATVSLAQAYWMKCPKCGGALKEETVLGLKGDGCEKCGGVFFDREEIVQPSETHEPHAFKEAFRRVFGAVAKKLPSGIGQFPV